MQKKGLFYAMSADMWYFQFSFHDLSGKHSLKSAVQLEKRNCPNNYRFIQCKVCGFWKMQQQQQNVALSVTILVNYKEFLEVLVLCNKK